MLLRCVINQSLLLLEQEVHVFSYSVVKREYLNSKVEFTCYFCNAIEPHFKLVNLKQLLLKMRSRETDVLRVLAKRLP